MGNILFCEWDVPSALSTSVKCHVAESMTLASELHSDGHGGGEDEGLARLDLVLSAAEVVVLAGYLATSGKAAKPLLNGVTGLLMAAATTGIVATPVLEVVVLRGKGAGKGKTAVIAAAVTLVSGLLLRYGVVFGGHTPALDREATLEATKPSRRAPGWGAHEP